MDKKLNELLFALIRSAISEAALNETEKALFSIDILPLLYDLAKKHDLSHLVSQALYDNGLIAGENKYCQKFQNDQFNAVFRYEQLNHQLNKVCAALQNIKIPFILLKGSVLRNYYPAPWMRTSCDIDILIERENLSKAQNYLIKNEGFTKTAEGNHDVTLTAPNTVQLELHFDLIEEGRAKDCRQVLSQFFENSKTAEGSEYKLESSDEMFYFYHIAHMAKHFEVGGCGIRPFIDLWILNNKITYNKEKRDALLIKGGLLQFSLVCEELSKVWFSGKEHSEITEKTERFILDGGIYGNTENTVLVKQAQKGGKFKFLLSRILPSYSALKNIYPTLENRPMLTPFFHIKRWCRIVFMGRTKKALREFKINSGISNDAKKEMQKFMDEIGLS